MEISELKLLADKVADLIVSAKKVVVFTGAGISTESGIPDFRSPGGVWERFNPDDFTYAKFLGDPEIRYRQWLMLTEGIAREAQPNQAHLAIGELHRLGRLDCVITQNVDNLHQMGGVPDGKVLELHGNLKWAVCVKCGKNYPLEQIKIRLDAGEKSPDCPVCQGILKPDVVFFGETLPELVLEESYYRASTCDLLIVIGSSLVVYPAAFIPARALRARAKLVIINLSDTPVDRYASVLIRAKSGETMEKVLEAVRQKI